MTAIPRLQQALRVTSTVMYLALSVFLVAFGILYASVTDLLFFHAAAVPKQALDDVKPLYFALMTLIGGSSGALGFLGGFITVVASRRGNSTSVAVAVALSYSVAFIMAAVTAEKLAAATHAPTSWHIMGVLLAITAVALGSHVLGKRAPGPARDGRM